MKLNLEQLENLRIVAGMIAEGTMIAAGTKRSVLGATIIALLDDYETARAEIGQLKQRIRDQDALIAPGSNEIWKAVEHLYEVANTPAKEAGEDLGVLYDAMQALFTAWEGIGK